MGKLALRSAFGLEPVWVLIPYDPLNFRKSHSFSQAIFKTIWELLNCVYAESNFEGYGRKLKKTPYRALFFLLVL
jgi:hypothetical protein